MSLLLYGSRQLSGPLPGFPPQPPSCPSMIYVLYTDPSCKATHFLFCIPHLSSTRSQSPPPSETPSPFSLKLLSSEPCSLLMLTPQTTEKLLTEGSYYCTAGPGSQSAKRPPQNLLSTATTPFAFPSIFCKIFPKECHRDSLFSSPVFLSCTPSNSYFAPQLYNSSSSKGISDLHR